MFWSAQLHNYFTNWELFVYPVDISFFTHFSLVYFYRQLCQKLFDLHIPWEEGNAITTSKVSYLT